MERRNQRAILICCVLLFAAVTVANGADYVGHEACSSCHATIYSEYIQSGHPYKLNKVEDGVPPTYPFSEVPSPPEGYAWEDVTYVIGGYGWKARFIDRNGYIITGDAVQYNLANGQWSGYHASEAPGTKPYTCGSCHTTGWQTTEENGGAKQDDLEGMAGTFASPGVTCEQCHGPGSDHISSRSKEDISVDPSKELCGTCHFRDSEHRIAASGGFIRHHEQYDELINSPHRFMECGTCHDPHKSTKSMLGGYKGDPVCTDCHSNVEVKVPAMADHRCETCHMPLAAKSAIVTKEFGEDEDTGHLGDIHSHTFKLNSDRDAQMFTADGKFVALDDEGDAIVKVEFACAGCHDGATASLQTVDWMYDNAAIVHTGGATAIAQVDAATLPTSFELHANYPNPFNPFTHIRYDLPEAGSVRLEIFDALGGHVQTLIEAYHPAGRYVAIWRGVDDHGMDVASGVYFYSIDVEGATDSRQMALVR